MNNTKCEYNTRLKEMGVKKLETWIIGFIAVVIGISIIAFVMKTFVRMAIILGVVYLLFHLGYVWGADDLNEKLGLDKWLDKSEQVQSAYGDFAKERDEKKMVNTDVISQRIDQAIQGAVDESVKQAKKVDKQQLISTLRKALQSFDAQQVEDALEKADKKLAEYEIKPEEI